MEKGYYINESCYENGILIAPGVEKKISQQMRVFEKHYEMKRIQIHQIDKHFVSKRIPFYKNTYVLSGLIDQIGNPKFIYFRKCRLERGMHVFFTQVKKKYPDCKIIIEIPTFPYDREFFKRKGGLLIHYPLYLKDIYYRNKVKNYVDTIVVYSKVSEIFGIKTINTVNGICVDDFKLSRSTSSDKIRLIAVANFQEGHGYERIIEGLFIYKKHNGSSQKVSVTFVGEGTEKEKYVKLVNEYGLQDCVTFTEQKMGSELDVYYDNADIGLGSFGMYKLDFDISSALKIREYLSRGIPIVSGCKEDILTDRNLPFYLEFSDENSPVDINKIVSFYNTVYGIKDIKQKIRRFAIEHVDMEKTLEPVIDFIEQQ